MSVKSMIRKHGATADVERNTTTRSPGGGRVASGDWPKIHLNVPVWKQDATSVEIEAFARRQLTITHRVYSATDLVLKEGDRFDIGGVKMVVRGIKDAAGLGRLWTYYVQEMIT